MYCLYVRKVLFWRNPNFTPAVPLLLSMCLLSIIERTETPQFTMVSGGVEVGIPTNGLGLSGRSE
jgi:hypothetical protein